MITQPLELLDPDDTWVLEAPLLARDAGDGRRAAAQAFDRPAVDAVGGAGDGEVRDASQIFDAREQDRLAVDRSGRRVEDGVDRIGPVARPSGSDCAGWRSKSSRSLTPRPTCEGRSRRPKRGRRRRRGGARRCGRPASTLRPRSGSARRVRARRCSRRSRSRRAACAAGCGRGTTRTRGAPGRRARPRCVTANAVSSASTSAAASSGCSSPEPGGCLTAAASVMPRQPEQTVLRGRTRHRTSAGIRVRSASDRRDRARCRRSGVPAKAARCRR